MKNAFIYVGTAVIIAEAFVLAGIHVIGHAAPAAEQAIIEIYEAPPIKTEIVTETAKAPAETEAPAETAEEVSLGSFKLTAYCGCTKCCGKNAKRGEDGEWLAITRSGVRAQANHTIAVDPDVIPLGSKVRIGDVIYTAEDTGGKWVQGNHIDIYMKEHSAAAQFGCQRAEVYLIKEEN